MADATVGQTISVGITVKDTTGTPADVGTGPTCQVTQPDGTFATATITHTGTGTYTAAMVAAQVGIHLFVWSASGANSAGFPYLDQVDVRSATLQWLVSLADVHSHLNVPASDVSHDVEFAGFIGAASEMITYWAGPILPTSYTEVRDAGGPVIMLDNAPVISITTVTEYWGLTAKTITNQPPGSTTDNFGYSLDDAVAGKLVRRDASGMSTPFIGGKRSVVITYLAGTAGPVSQTIRMAVLEDMRGLYQQTQQGARPQFGQSSMSDDNWGASAPMNMFPRLQAILSGTSRIPSIA